MESSTELMYGNDYIIIATTSRLIKSCNDFIYYHKVVYNH